MLVAFLMSESEVVLRMIKKNEKLTSKSELFVQELLLRGGVKERLIRRLIRLKT